MFGPGRGHRLYCAVFRRGELSDIVLLSPPFFVVVCRAGAVCRSLSLVLPSNTLQTIGMALLLGGYDDGRLPVDGESRARPHWYITAASHHPRSVCLPVSAQDRTEKDRVWRCVAGIAHVNPHERGSKETRREGPSAWSRGDLLLGGDEGRPKQVASLHGLISRWPFRRAAPPQRLAEAFISSQPAGSAG